MRRRKKWLSCILMGAAIWFAAGNVGMDTVYAGDINSAESMIVSYYNGTFQYQGKTYVATDEAKAATYNKLVQDGVDLTYSEARSAIAQANSQIADGIAQGILVEVSQEEPGTTDGDDGNRQENGDTGNSTSSDTSSSNKNDVDNTEKSDDSNKEDTSEKKEEKKTNKKKSEKTESSEVVDIHKMIEDAAQNPNRTTVIRQDGNKYQIIDFETGEQMEVASDGTVLSHSEIPFKTQEKAIHKLPDWIWAVLFALLAALFAIGVVNAFRRKKSEHRGSQNKKLRTIYSVMVSVVICVCVSIAFGAVCLYAGYIGITGNHMMRTILISLGVALAFGVVLWMQYHYKHRAIRYVAYAFAVATVADAAIVIWLLNKRQIEQSSLLIIGIEALVTIVCFRMVSLLKHKSR